MTETEDNDIELPSKEIGDGSGTLGPGDETAESNLHGSIGEAKDSDGLPPLSYMHMLGPGDITINTDLAGLDGASTDAIQLPEGRFDLGSKLGQGGMAVVFSAQDSTLNREIAVKVLSGKEWVGLTRFVREAQVTAQLSHPNVVPVYGLEKKDGSPALSMKLIRGCLLYTSPSPRDKRQSRMPSSA